MWAFTAFKQQQKKNKTKQNPLLCAESLQHQLVVHPVACLKSISYLEEENIAMQVLENVTCLYWKVFVPH